MSDEINNDDIIDETTEEVSQPKTKKKVKKTEEKKSKIKKVELPPKEKGYTLVGDIPKKARGLK